MLSFPLGLGVLSGYIGAGASVSDRIHGYEDVVTETLFAVKDY